MDPGTAEPVCTPEEAQCRMSREELQQLLDRCGYGANVEMFNCYFRTNAGGPPLCIYCNMAVHAHKNPVETASCSVPKDPLVATAGSTSGACHKDPVVPATTTTTCSGDPEAQVEPASAVLVSEDGLAADLGVHVETRNVNWNNRISCLIPQGSTDEVRTPYPTPLLVLMGAFVAIAIVIAIIFTAIGLYNGSAPAYAVCGICLTISAFVGLFLSKRNVRFHKDTRQVDFEEITLYCCCCPTKITTSFDNLGAVEAQDTLMRDSYRRIFLIVAKLIEPVNGVDQIRLMKHFDYVGLEEQVSDWRLYLSSLTGRVHG